MPRLRLSELAQMVNGTLTGADVAFDGVSTDSRSLGPGQLFVALQGPNFDGHDYLQVAAERGAAGALVRIGGDRAIPAIPAIPTVQVKDTLLALGDLGRGWRERSAACVIGITGSNGKTTLKEMTAAILAQSGSVLATHGNLNNAIGVPLTLCRIREEAFAVIEMGANHAGEIGYLTGLVRPDVAVLNNAGRAHLEGFGSLEGVARAKAEIVQGLGPDGVFVFNADDVFAPLWRELAVGHTWSTFGVHNEADVSSPADAYRIVWRDHGFEVRFPIRAGADEVELCLSLAGEHNRMNALAATAASLAVGARLADAAPGLAGLQAVPGRLCPLPGIAGARLIDDSYNANPDSVLAALKVLAAAPGRRTLVLGDLAELGPEAASIHRQLGADAGALGIHRLLTVGELSAAAGIDFGGEHRHFSDREGLAEALLAQLSAEDSVLVKGSRAAAMDRLVAQIRAGDAAC